MNKHSDINPAETYVLDDEDLAELEGLGLTGIVRALTDPSPHEHDDDSTDRDG